MQEQDQVLQRIITQPSAYCWPDCKYGQGQIMCTYPQMEESMPVSLKKGSVPHTLIDRIAFLYLVPSLSFSFLGPQTVDFWEWSSAGAQ